MAKRRRKYANGQGSITHVKGKKSPWWARLPATYDSSGKEHRKTVGFYKTQKEAQNALDSYTLIDDIKTFKDIYIEYKKTDNFLNLSKKNKRSLRRFFLIL